MDLHRLGFKFFAADPESVPIREFIPVFHTWIQKQAAENHMLIDVHNYSHIHHGPGILLVAQEGNFSIDLADGKMGLLYYRKKAGADLLSIMKSTLQGCSLLEADPRLSGRLQFRTDELLVLANDRLLTPNNDDTFNKLKPDLAAALQPILPSGKFTMKRSSTNPKERFAIRVQTGQSENISALLSRLNAS